MIRRLAFGLVFLVVLAWAPAAFGAFPGPYAVQGGQGVLSKDGTLRFATEKAGSNTLLKAIRRSDGTIAMSTTIPGAFGTTIINPNGGYGEGLSRDGGTLVLETVGLNPQSQLLLVNTSDLSTRDTITLKGTFSYDAMSPDGARMYLIQHKSVNDVNHYVVRGYDLKEHALLPGRIADKTQKSWIMEGWSVDRVASANGRWVYTLYANPGGTPFVHALDTVAGVAHCVGVPWPQTSDQGELYSFRLGLKGTRLAVRRQDGSTYRFINTKSWRVTKPAVR